MSLCVVAGALATVGAADAATLPSPSDYVLREARIALGAGKRVDPKYLYLFDQGVKWVGPMRWKYNPANAPAFASDTPAVVSLIRNALEKWSSQCGVTYIYDGETDVAPNSMKKNEMGGDEPDGTSVVGWDALDPSLGAWTYAWYAQDGGVRAIYDADVTLNTRAVASLADLDRLMTHEWGHALGLDHSDHGDALMAGPPYTAYNQQLTPQADDLRGCRCAYGLPGGASGAYACSVPSKLDLGTSAVGSTTSTRSIPFTNNGNVPLSIQAVSFGDARFRQTGGCAAGSVVQPGQTCTLDVAATPTTAGAVASKVSVYTNDGSYDIALTAAGGSVPAAQTVQVVEYYNAELDHYFITWVAAEIANLDQGVTPSKWTRTGRAFNAYVNPQAGTSEVCRFYIPPSDGNSHFFGRGVAECQATRTAQPDFVLEDPDYMHVVLPAAGMCPSATQPVYRVFNNRADANHRYTTDRAVRDAMVAKGWIAEGDGSDRVVMCVPA